jgi:tetratricopeptide (TPR) repeat protein
MVFQRETSSVRGAQEYLFKHALLREATYESVLRRDRRIYHAAAARWLIERSQDRQSEFAGQIAEHLVRAGQLEEAVEYLRRAGEQAAGQFANDQAVQSFSEALDLLPGEAVQMRFNLLLQRTRLFHRMGKPDQELEDVQALEAQSVNLGPEQQIQSAFCHASACERQADCPDQNGAIRSAVELAQSIGRIDLEAEGCLLSGMLTCMDDGRYALQMLESALALARQAGLKHLEPDIYKYQSHAYQNLNNHQAAFEAARMSCEISHALGDLYGEGRALAMMGNAIAEVGDVVSAIQYEIESERICREAGNIYDEAYAQMNVWLIYESLGMWEHQAEMLRQGIEEIAVPRVTAISQMMYYSHRAKACSRASDPARMLVYAEKVLTICPDHPEDIGWFTYAKTVLGEALAANSRDEEALACLVEAAQLYQGKPDIFRLIVLERLVRFLVSRHQIDQVLPYLEELYPYDWQDYKWWKGYFAIQAVLTCFQAFQACGDPRADQALEKAHEAIEYCSASITDEEIRRSYRQNLPWNREVLRLWAEKTKS